MGIYVGARDLNGVAIGTHQFIVLTYEHPIAPLTIGNKQVSTRILGHGTRGIVIGAQNRGDLVVEFFEENDFSAAMEHFGGKEAKWYKSDFSAELKKVSYGSVPEPEAKRRIFHLVGAYLLNQTISPIRYLTIGFGVNSNSWVQSVVEYSGGKVDGDMFGLDISQDKRIPHTYFEAVCPKDARPQVN